MKRVVFALCCVTAALSLPVCADQYTKKEPVVIQEGGVSALRYYDSLSSESGEKAIQPLPDIQLQKRPGEFSAFPVVSEKLSPGRVEARTISASGLVQPIFMIGYDKLSAEWLSKRKNILKQLNAIGLVVNVPNAQAMAELQGIAPELMLQPISGDGLADRIGIENYPLLVTQASIEQ